MFKDLPEGQTHSYNDGCGEPEHNKKSLSTIIKEAENSFDELEFASCPTEEQEPFYWRWTEHGKDILKSFLTEQITKAVNSALEATRLEDKETMVFNRKLTDGGGYPDVKAIGFNQAVAEQAKKISNFIKE